VGMMMAVSFERYGRLYYLDPGAHKPAIGDKVLVPTDSDPRWPSASGLRSGCRRRSADLPVCAGLASDDDLPGTRRTASAGPRAGSPPAA
jgi:hypothetical protein